MMNEQTFHYYAFISHASEDARWAKWLQHKLSYYHIPASVRKSRIGLPQKLRPIFIYEYDLSGNRLHDALQQELVSSKYLIVICSPEAARSTYVNGEIETFIQQGRADHIIPLIVSGTVKAANPAEECFPPALLALCEDQKTEMRGIDIRTNGKRHALIDVVATMLGVRRNVLWDRYKARLLKQRIAMGLVALLAVMLGLFYWDYTRPTYEYYADYVDCWGVPKGVIELNKEQRSRRYGFYRFEKRRIPFGEPNAYDWRLDRVCYVNSAGTPIEINESEYIDRYPIQKCVYSSQNGHLTMIVFYTNSGQEILRHRISEYNGEKAAIVDIESVVDGGGISHRKSQTAISSLISESDTEISYAKISRYYVFRNDNGYVEGKRYHRSNDRLEESIIADAWGISGELYKLDSLGRCIERRYVDFLNGEYQIGDKGIVVRIYKYDSYGNICETRCYDADLNPTVNGDGWAVEISQSDGNGNITEGYYLNEKDEPCYQRSMGFHRVTLQYDSSYNPHIITLYDIEGNVTTGKNGYAKAVFKYDKQGRVTQLTFFDDNNQPCLSQEGIHMTRLKYDDNNNNVTELSFYDIEKQLCMHKDGYAIIRNKYIAKGLIARMSYYGVDGNPILCNDGYASMELIYDDKYDKVIEQVYYGINNKVISCDQGYATMRLGYDDRGNINVYTFLDINHSNTKIKDGYAILQKIFNDNGHVMEIRTYAADTTLCMNKDSCAITRFEYDSNGNQKSIAYYDSNDSPCISTQGAHKILIDYDNHKNITTISYLDTDEKPIAVEGNIKIEFDYNEQNDCIEKRYYNHKNVRYKIEQLVYDKKGREIQIIYLNQFYKPYLDNSEAIACVYIYDKYDNCVERYYINKVKALTLGPDGYAKMITAYDIYRNIVDIAFYNDHNTLFVLAEAGFARNSTIYRHDGKILNDRYYNASNELCLGPKGYAKMVVEYNAQGKQIERSFYDESNELKFINEAGFARNISKYNNDGNILEDIYYGEFNELCVGPEGYAKVVVRYDSQGRQIEISFYNEEEKLKNPDNFGYARHQSTYDELGLLIEDRYYDTSNEFCLEPEDYAKIVVRYNSQGKQIERSFYDESNELKFINEAGFARNISKYNNDGNILEDIYYGEFNELCVGPEDYAKMVIRYNSQGKQIERSFYNESNELKFINEAGFARNISKYNNDGNILEDIYYDEFNELCVGPEGYAHAIVEEPFEEPKVTYYDENGNDITERIMNQLQTN